MSDSLDSEDVKADVDSKIEFGDCYINENIRHKAN